MVTVGRKKRSIQKTDGFAAQRNILVVTSLKSHFYFSFPAKKSLRALLVPKIWDGASLGPGQPTNFIEEIFQLSDPF